MIMSWNSFIIWHVFILYYIIWDFLYFSKKGVNSTIIYTTSVQKK